MKYFYNFGKTLGSYYANETEEIEQNGYAAEFHNWATMDFKWNRFEAFFYNNGRVEDIEINGWVFSHKIEGEHRKYPVMNPDSPIYTIKGIDPTGNKLEVEIHTSGFFKAAAADFMNNIFFISKFPDSDSAIAFYKMENWEKNLREFGKIIDFIKEVKDFYEWQSKDENCDEKFMKQIKTSINNNVEECKRLIESIKI